MIIYKITNTINDKVYIGQTIKSLEERWFRHLNDSKRMDYYFYKAIRKYGTECWTHKILEQCENINDLNEREVYWINHYTSMNKLKGYNSTSGGEGRIIDAEWKMKMSISHTGRKHSEETKEKMSKTYVIIDPDGNEFEVTNLTKWCRENNLDAGSMSRVAIGKYSHHKRFKCKLKLKEID